MEIEEREMKLQMLELQVQWRLRDLEDTIKKYSIGITNTS